MDEKRHNMLEEQLREEIASLILRGEVKDPRVGPLVSVTRVDAARDASHAKVYVSTFAQEVLGGAEGESPESRAESDRLLDAAVFGLQSAAGFIQAQIAKRIRVRLTPKLHFVADRGIREGFEMNERLRNLIP